MNCVVDEMRRGEHDGGWGSVVSAGLVVGDSIVVLEMTESSTVSISGTPLRTTYDRIDLSSLLKAANGDQCVVSRRGGGL